MCMFVLCNTDIRRPYDVRISCMDSEAVVVVRQIHRHCSKNNDKKRCPWLVLVGEEKNVFMNVIEK